MKNLIKNGILTLMLITALTISANEPPTLRNLNDGKTTLLTLSNIKKGNTLIIKDLHEKVFYEEYIQTNGKFEKGFKLRLLADGAYYFELETYQEVKKIPFTVINNSVDYNKENESTIIKTSSQAKGNYLLAPKQSPIKMPIAGESARRRVVLSYKGNNFIKDAQIKK